MGRRKTPGVHRPAAVLEGAYQQGGLTGHFGISVPQASADISRYQELAPDNIEYDASAKTYVDVSRVTFDGCTVTDTSYRRWVRLQD
jgi:hypothetical protein